MKKPTINIIIIAIMMIMFGCEMVIISLSRSDYKIIGAIVTFFLMEACFWYGRLS